MNKPTIHLNIFTNAHGFAPSTELVERTYQSFCDTFGKLPVTVYCDPHPHEDKAREYTARLKKIFTDVRESTSLSDGYVKSINDSDADYLFQLEGDWIFRRQWITHTLDEILQFMVNSNTYHFRFNKRPNLIAGWDKYMTGDDIKGFEYCRCNNMTNNPHIINRDIYQNNILQYIKIKPGSKGIEKELNDVGDFVSRVYGAEGHPATIEHLDGRKLDRRFKRRVRLV